MIQYTIYILIIAGLIKIAFNLNGLDKIVSIIPIVGSLTFILNPENDIYSKSFILLSIIIMPIAIMACDNCKYLTGNLLIIYGLLILAFTSDNFIVFYIAFEAVLIPVFILIIMKGSEKIDYRKSAAYRIFIYTFGTSVVCLIGIILLYISTKTNKHISLLYIEKDSAYLILPLIGLAFATKIPMIPLHLWLPEAHTISPTPVSMILAALLLKLGGYGFLKWGIEIFPEESKYYAPYLSIIAIISTIYAVCTSLRQIDVKRIIAYSSIVHMNVVIFSIATLSKISIIGGIFEMFSHGIISALMFYLIGILYKRYNTRTLKYFRGLANVMPLFSSIFFIGIIANSGVPLTSGFIGEFIMISGAIKVNLILTICITLTFIINAGSAIWLFNRLCFGSLSSYNIKVADITRKEAYTIIPLILFIFLFGIKPNLILALLN